MKKKWIPLLSRLYSHLGISSLSAKLLIPVAVLMVITLIISIVAFNYNTRRTQDQLLGQQLDADSSRLQQGFQQRLEALSAAAAVLANDPITIQNTPLDTDDALEQLISRSVIVRDRFELDLVQIYDAEGKAQANFVSSNLYREPDMILTTSISGPHFHYANEQLMILERKEMHDGIGTVIVGIDLSTELNRLLQQYRLTSDVTISIDNFVTGSTRGMVCNMETGFIDDNYIRQYEFPLADRKACMLLSRPATGVQQVLRGGLYVMVSNTLMTITLLSGLLIAITTAITKPIRKLSEAAQAVAQGDLNRHVTADEVSSLMGIGRNDELSLQAQAFNRMVTDLHTLYTSLEERVANRTRELTVTTDVARAVAESNLDLRRMSRSASVAIQRRYGFDLVGILRYDQSHNQFCLVSGAQKLDLTEIPDGMCIPVDGNAVLQTVLRSQQAHISQVNALEPVQYRIPNLPTKGSYAMIPIRTGDKIHGLVYAQHHQNNYIHGDIVAMLHNAADQIAIGFENVELYTLAQNARDAAQAASQAKGQFLAHMSHELRTPMNAILGFTQVLLRSESITHNDKDHLEIIYRSGEHLLALINDVLDMSKIEAGRSTLTISNFDLYDQLTELELMFNMRAKDAGLELEMVTHPDTPRYIRTDQGKLRQVLINLLGNAIKFTQSGAITVKVSPVSAPETTNSPMGHFTQQRVRFEVIDTGPGIAIEDQERIFEAFVQTENHMQQGTGLGLPISREFVHTMGGELVVHSSEGTGSTFSFELELQIVNEGSAVSKKEIKKIVSTRSSHPLKILVADDNPGNRRLITEIMTNVGLPCREVDDGRQAVEIVESWMPDLIWMDMRMPNLDGEQAAKEIREYCDKHDIEAPVIIAITASIIEGEEQTIKWCDDLIWKPFHDYKLYMTMQEHLDIEFIMEKPQEVNQSQDDDTDVYIAAKQIDITIRSRLESAITRLDMQDIDQLIADIIKAHAALGRYLQNLAASFDYDTILQLIRHTDPERTSAPEG